MKIENLLLIFSISTGMVMFYFVFYIQNFVIRITLICLIAYYLISINWYEKGVRKYE